MIYFNDIIITKNYDNPLILIYYNNIGVLTISHNYAIRVLLVLGS